MNRKHKVLNRITLSSIFAIIGGFGCGCIGNSRDITWLYYVAMVSIPAGLIAILISGLIRNSR